MISIHEADKILDDTIDHLALTRRHLTECQGYVLAENIEASEDVPPFHRAMMDGYALQAADTVVTPATLDTIDFVPAGRNSTRNVLPGQAVKILTGAPVPDGADAVQQIELCREHGHASVDILEPIPAGKNIAPRGSEFRQGQTALLRGTPVGPAQAGILATFGFAEVTVHRKPRVALINTGSELVSVDQPLETGQIRNSNLYTLTALLAGVGFRPDCLGMALDTLDDTRKKLVEAGEREVIILTGGVSMGEYDLVEEAARAEGFTIMFTRVAIKPGKPLVYGIRGHQRLFGLAGNPVSSMVQAARFVVPALRKMAGWAHAANSFHQAIITSPVSHRPGRDSHRPALLLEADGRLICQPIPDKGSADLFAYRNANGLYIIPSDCERLEAGQSVMVMRLPGFFA